MAIAVTTLSRLSGGDNWLKVQSTLSPPRAISRDLLTIAAHRAAFDNAVEPAGDTEGEIKADSRLDLFFVDLIQDMEGDQLADLVGSELAGDISRFRPIRPGRLREPPTPLHPSNDQDLFYPHQEDKVATLTVVRPISAAEAKRTGEAREIIYKTNRFLLQNSMEMRAEKAQIVDTQGDPQLFLFGSRPEVWQYSGVLMNTNNFRWKSEWIRAYETYLRGTRARELGLKVFLTYDDLVREGWILSTGVSQSHSSLRTVSFNFTMFITRKRLFSFGPGARSSYEIFDQSELNRQSDQGIQQQIKVANELGIPIAFDGNFDINEEFQVRQYINQAVRLGVTEPPYVFAKATRSSGLDLAVIV